MTGNYSHGNCGDGGVARVCRMWSPNLRFDQDTRINTLTLGKTAMRSFMARTSERQRTSSCSTGAPSVEPLALPAASLELSHLGIPQPQRVRLRALVIGLQAEAVIAGWRSPGEGWPGGAVTTGEDLRSLGWQQ